LRTVVTGIAEIVHGHPERGSRLGGAAVFTEALVGRRHVVNGPVSEGPLGRVGILDDDGKAARVAWRILPFERRRDVAAVLAVALRDSLAVREGRTCDTKCHVMSPRCRRPCACKLRTRACLFRAIHWRCRPLI